MVKRKKYNKGINRSLTSDIDLAKIHWTSSELDSNNIELAFAGGSFKHAMRWAQEDKRFWTGLIFPCSFLVEQDQPCEKEFYTLEELRQI